MEKDGKENENGLLTIPEVAARLRLSKWSARDLVRRGVLPSIRIGRRIRVRAEALDAWLRSREKGESLQD